MKLISLLFLFVQSANAITPSYPIGTHKLEEYRSGSRNYVKNPSAYRNTGNTTTSSAAIARDTDAADKLDGLGSFTCDTSAQNGYCEFTLDTIQEGDKSGNCEFKGLFKGDGSLYRAQIISGGSTVAQTSVLRPVS